MSPPAHDWLSAFRELHEKAKAGGLSLVENQAYSAQAEMFCRAILGAQSMPLLPGVSARRSFRIGVVLPVELYVGQQKVASGATLDLSSGGFSILGEPSFAIGQLVSFKLLGHPEINGGAKVAGCAVHDRGSRTSFSFENLDDATQTRIDSNLIDLALARIAR